MKSTLHDEYQMCGVDEEFDKTLEHLNPFARRCHREKWGVYYGTKETEHSRNFWKTTFLPELLISETWYNCV